MTKRTVATNWDVVSKDITGAFGSFDYTCPYCHYNNYEMIFIGAQNIDKIANDFETDQECKICQKNVIVEIR